MSSRPRFRSCYQVEIIDDQHVFLLAERGNRLFTGEAYVLIAGLLDGSRTVGEVVSAAAEKVSAAEIYYALQQLESLGCTGDAGSALPKPVAAFWEALGLDATAAAQRTGACAVSPVGLNGIATAPLVSALTDLGIDVVEEAGLAVALVDDYLQPALAALNERCLREDRPWLLAKPVGSTVWIGPLLRPGQTGCWECLAHRLRSSRPVESFVQAQKGYSHPRLQGVAALPSTELAAAALLATELAKWIAGAPESRLEGSLLTFDLATFGSERHTLVRRPQCPVCGSGASWAEREPTPVRLEGHGETVSVETGHRTIPPEETLRRFEPHVSSLIGVVGYVRPATGVASAIAPVYHSGQNAAIMDDTLYFIRSNSRSKSGGKGRTEAQAKASALCEAIERYSGVFQGDEIRTRSSYLRLAGKAIDPRVCMNFSAAQYAGRSEWNASRVKVFQKVPAPFDERAEIEWTPLWSLSEERFKYLPTAYCYFGYPFAAAERFCWPDSNGNAAGNSLAEAILQGFMELVERDCVAIWWYNRLSRPGVDLDSFDEPYFRELRGYYRALNREVWVIDITNDLEIPAFAALTRRTDTTPQDITYGFAAHFDPRVALLRALTEANQSLPIVLPRHADPRARYNIRDEDVQRWLATSTLDNCPYLAPAAGALKSADDYPVPARAGDLKHEVEACVRIAGEHGMETLVLDQTRPDVGLAVVKVVVPGLRQFWPRFAPGRLYDVPVALGWRSAPLDERDLNPLPIYF
jgi:ribosomal protein S12 methylthiotransferase accessory factor